MHPTYPNEYQLKVKTKSLFYFQKIVKWTGGRFKGNPIIFNDVALVNIGFPESSNMKAFNVSSTILRQPFF